MVFGIENGTNEATNFITQNFKNETSVCLLECNNIKLNTEMFSIWFEGYKELFDSKSYLLSDSWYRILDGYPLEFYLPSENPEINRKNSELMRERLKEFNRINESIENIVIPCCHSGIHWSLCVYKKLKNVLEVYDGYNYGDYKKLVLLLNFYNNYGNDVTLKKIKCPTQFDAWSCGYRMLYFIKNLFINKNEKLVVNGGDLNISLYSDILNELSIIYNKVEVMNLFFDKWKKFEFGKGYDNTLFENKTIE